MYNCASWAAKTEIPDYTMVPSEFPSLVRAALLRAIARRPAGGNDTRVDHDVR
jgi:hypothetical protein